MVKSKISYGKKYKKMMKKNKSVTTRLLPHEKAKIEKKYSDVYIATDVPDTGKLTLLNGISQAVTENGRIGNRIDLKSVQYRLNYFSNSTRKDTLIRVMLVYDKEGGVTGAAPAIFGGSATDSILFYTTGTSGGTTALLNMNNRDRYVVLSDKIHQFKHTFANDIEVSADKFKYMNTYTQFNAVGGGIAQINAGALYLIQISDQPAGLNEDPLVIGNTRVRYTDA